MERIQRKHTTLELLGLHDGWRFGRALACPHCRSDVDRAEVEASTGKVKELDSRRFSYVCTVCSSYGEHQHAS